MPATVLAFPGTSGDGAPGSVALADLPVPAQEVRKAKRRTSWDAWLLTLVAVVGYVYAAKWLRYDFGFDIGDAVARTAEAKYIVLSRDAHAAALGFYWMPIPTISQVPLVLVLQHWGQAEFAGPLSSALWGAGTVFVLGHMARDLRIPRLLGILLVIAYAANPVTIYYAANGMQEMTLFFFLALTMSGTLSYTSRASVSALLRAAIGLTGVILTRYEAVPLLFVVPPILALADVRRNDRSRAKATFALAGLPAAWGLALWFFYMKLVGGSFFAFRASQKLVPDATPAQAAKATGAVAKNLPQTPIDAAMGSIPAATGWALEWLVNYAPILLLLPLLLIPLRRKSLGTLTIAAITVVLPSLTIFLMSRNGSSGEPRYFVGFVILGTLAAFWGAARLTSVPAWLRYPVSVLAAPVLVGGLVLGAVSGSYALTDVDDTKQNAEARVFGHFLTPETASTVGGTLLPPWRTFAAELDRQLPPKQLVLADTNFSFAAFLLSDRSQQFVAPSDRDYQTQTAQTGSQSFNYVIVPPPQSRGGLAANDAGALVVERADAGTWIKVFETPGAAALYRRAVPLPPGGRINQRG